MCYQQAARLKSNYFEANHNLGNALSEQGRWDEAIAAYDEAMRIRPDEPRVLKCLAITLCRQEKFGAALEAFRRAVQVRPGLLGGLERHGHYARPPKQAP